MNLCIVTISRGERPWLEFSEKSMRSYANKCNADFIRGEDLKIDVSKYKDIPFGRETGIYLFERLPIINQLLKKYDRVLWLDDTCIISKYCPDIFKTIPYGYLGAHNEGVLDWVKSFNEMSKLLENNNFDLRITRSQYFNAGVLLTDKSHAILYDENKLLHFGNLGYFSDPWVDQTYLNILTRRMNIPIFELPNFFNRMMVFVQGPGQIEYTDLFRETDKLIVPINDIQSFINDKTVSPGNYNHAFIWHLTSFWDNRNKYLVMKELYKYSI